MSTAPAPPFTRAGMRRALIGIELVLALNAVGGAVCAFGGAEGIDREGLDGTPVNEYVVPGVILLVAVGGALAIAATSLRLSPTTAPTLIRRSSCMAYGAFAATLWATILALLVGSDADWRPAVAFAVGPDLGVLYGIAPGLARGQLHPRAVPLHNALHRFWGPLALLASATAAGLSVGWVAAALAWAFHVAFDRTIGLGLRSADGFRRGDPA